MNYAWSRGRDINPNTTKKNTMVWRKNPKVVGHPLTATPPRIPFTNRKVIGFATRKNANAE